jgi:hypothetical protein
MHARIEYWWLAPSGTLAMDLLSYPYCLPTDCFAKTELPCLHQSTGTVVVSLLPPHRRWRSVTHILTEPQFKPDPYRR